jgi:hypothetical protein
LIYDHYQTTAYQYPLIPPCQFPFDNTYSSMI